MTNKVEFLQLHRHMSMANDIRITATKARVQGYKKLSEDLIEIFQEFEQEYLPKK